MDSFLEYRVFSRAGAPLEPGWPCNGPLLRLAEDAATRLLPAFDTATGMPYGTVNLRHGVPKGETPVTCVAAVATYIVEFGALSRPGFILVHAHDFCPKNGKCSPFLELNPML